MLVIIKGEGDVLYSDNQLNFILIDFGLVNFAFNAVAVILWLISIPKHPLIDYLLSLKFFIVMERIHTSFYFMSDIIIYLIYSAFEFDLKLSYQNLLFLTIGLTFFVIFFSFLVTYLIELNVRKVIKGFLKNDIPMSSNNTKRTLSDFSVTSMNSLQTINVY